jgi:hypothetical protein
VPSFRAVTTAPGRLAFDASSTVPEIVPTDWASADAADTVINATTSVVTRNQGCVISAPALR